MEITPGKRRRKCCIPQKQPPARTARSLIMVMLSLSSLRVEHFEPGVTLAPSSLGILAGQNWCTGAEHPPRSSSISTATSCDRYTERLEASTVLGDGKDGF